MATPERRPAARLDRGLRRAAAAYRQAFVTYRAMSIANPGHMALPALSERLDAARAALFTMLERSKH